MKRFQILAAVAFVVPQVLAADRPPAVPLIAHDPYFSVWSFADRLADQPTKHWTGAEQPLTSLIRVDGRAYRLMGAEPSDVPALPQTGVQVTPTRTIATYRGAGVRVTLTFLTPSLPDDLDVLSRPASYLVWAVQSTDGETHDASVYFDASARLAVDRASQKVVWGRGRVAGLTSLRIGSEEQPVLGKSGDNLRIDWGHLWLAGSGAGFLGRQKESAASFVESGKLPGKDDRRGPVAADDGDPAAALVLPIGKVGARPVERRAILAYDDGYSIQYFGRNLRPYWRRNGMDGQGLLAAADRDFEALRRRSIAFDAELTSDLTRVGGRDLAYLGALAYRQSLAAQKLCADVDGGPVMFSKENFSNGCIATVDVLYPAAPQLLLLSPALMKASLVPVMEYSASSRWKWPFAPHDLGTYPLANGQVYGGGEATEDNQMPVEESGNMLILLTALAQAEGNANFAGRYWGVLGRWADYLADKGFDPESQLSTDDFAGHLAHNVNLSAKAIVALGAYAKLAKMRGEAATADKFEGLAREFAARWVKEADDGAAFRLAFDRPGTWSQKYNLVWDRVLGLNLFPASVARREMDHYLRMQNAYGLPLDNRRDYTKLDWIVWTACLTGDRSDFDALVGPTVDFLNETPDRAPMPDWFRTTTPRKEGFQARSVVGGVFMPLLTDPAVWSRYASRSVTTVGKWTPIPAPPVVTPVVPTAQAEAIEWAYTTSWPGEDWMKPAYDDSGWRRGPAGFGTAGTPGTAVRTEWSTPDIWIRRTFELPAGFANDLWLNLHHDEDAVVYVNGVVAARLGGFVAKYTAVPMSREARAALRPGANILAIHCRQTSGGQYIDCGLATVSPGQ